MKICVLENDVLDSQVAPIYRRYGDMFARLFQAAGAHWEMDMFHTPQGEYPAHFADYDAVLLTGSRADAFSQAPWVATLREQVTQLLAQNKKLVGICFGHQLIAACLGAPIGRASQGWGAGRMCYQWHAPELAPGRREIALLASHQDQVFALPAGATLLASSAFCPIAAFRLGQNVICVQAHPEFVEDYSAYLLHKRRALLGEAQFQASIESLQLGHDGVAMARIIADFVASQASQAQPASRAA